MVILSRFIVDILAPFLLIILLQVEAADDSSVCLSVANSLVDCINLFPSCSTPCISAFDTLDSITQSSQGDDSETCQEANVLYCPLFNCCSFCDSEFESVFACLVFPDSCTLSCSGASTTVGGSSGNSAAASSCSGKWSALHLVMMTSIAVLVMMLA